MYPLVIMAALLAPAQNPTTDAALELAAAVRTAQGGADPRPRCPAGKDNCSCGCRDGYQCTCTVKAAKPTPEELQEAIKQRLAYRLLCDYASDHPGELVLVYVKCDPPAAGSDYVNMHCRFDAGPWDPPINEPTRVVATFRGGQFVELRRDRIGGPAAAGGVARSALQRSEPQFVPWGLISPSSLQPWHPVRIFVADRPLFGGGCAGGTCVPGRR